MRLGILGGSFNPIHHGHLVIATRTAEKLKLQRILFVPTVVSPLKRRRDMAPDSDRLAMVRLAIRGEPRFEACDIEIRRGGTSYTVDTLRELKKRRSRSKLFLILGADAMELLPKWRDLEGVLRLCRLVGMGRPGHSHRGKMPKYIKVDAPLLEISGTEIRKRVRQGLSIRYLVPEPVEGYIRKKGLYR